jgi:hypothetical protein
MLGTSLVLVDVTIVNPLADTYVVAEATTPGNTLRLAEAAKDKRHVTSAEARNMLFYPLALTTFGTLGPRSLALLRKCSQLTADPRGFMRHMCMALSVAVQIGNARILTAAVARWWESGVR